MRFGTLASGSNGNSVLVENNGRAILVDAGLTGIKLQARIHEAGLEMEDITDVVLTHGHGDHARGARAGHVKWGWRVWCTDGTKRIWERLQRIETHRFEPGDTLDLEWCDVRTAGVFHDAPEAVAVRVVDRQSGASVAVATDLGIVDEAVEKLIKGVGGLVIETNHDVEMLWRGAYPKELKQRVLSQLGHLSNEQAASAIAKAWHSRLEWVLLAHISRENNNAKIALEAVQKAVAGLKGRGKIRIAWRDQVSGLYRIHAGSPIDARLKDE